MPLTRWMLIVGSATLLTTQLLNGQPQPAPTDRQGDALPPGALLRMGSVRMRHAEWIWSVAFSPDNTSVASADYGGTVRLWDLKTGRQLRELPAKSGSVVAFAPDGKVLATCGYYQQHITLWDLTNGEKLRQMPQNARSVAFSADSRLLAAAGQDGVVRFWDVNSGKLFREFKGHIGGLYSVALAADGKLCASAGGGDGTAPQHTEIRLWDIERGTELRRLEGHNGWVYALAFAGDGKTLASASPYDVRIWDLEKDKERHLLEKCSYAVAFSPTTQQLATAGAFGFYDPASGQQLLKLEGDLSESQCVACSPDGKWLATGDRKGRLQLWDATTGKELVRHKGHSQAISAVAFSLDGSVAASASSRDGTLRIWGLASGAQLRLIEVGWGSESSWYPHGQAIFFPPDGKLVGVASGDGKARYFELSGKRRHEQFLTEGTSRMTQSRDGNLMAVATTDKGPGMEVRLFELDGGKELMKCAPLAKENSPDCWLTCLAFSPDSKLLAIALTAGERRTEGAKAAPPTIQLWDVATGKQVRSFRREETAPGWVVFSPDGTMLAAAATGRVPLQVWDVASGEELGRFAEKDTNRSWYEWSPCAFSPDNKVLMGANKSIEIVLWEIVTGREIRRFKGHANAVTALACSPDGRTLLSGSEDATVLLWDLAAVPSPAPKPAVPRDAKRENELWEDLADADPAVAHRAAGQLFEAPQQALGLFRTSLRPAAALDTTRIPQLIADLGHAEETRQRAACAELKQFGIQATSALHEGLRANRDVAVRRRIETVLEAIGEYPVPPDELRRLRCVQLLERLGTPEAEQVLKQLAQDEADQAQSGGASAALRRLDERRRVQTVVVEADR